MHYNLIFAYAKALKTGSSTLAGVNTRIATNHTKREITGNVNNNNGKCKSESSHEWCLKHDTCKRDKVDHSFGLCCVIRPIELLVNNFICKLIRKELNP